MDRLHTDREYESELKALREQVLFMGATVETVLTGAVQAFQDRDVDKARQIASLDTKIDLLELDIDDGCLHILARRQPVASDLRFITTALKVVTDLERIGDLAKNICERVEELSQVDLPAGKEQIEEMADIARNMLRDALDAFVARDPTRAHSVPDRDKRVDELYADMFPMLIKYMSGQQPEQCDAAMRILSIAKYLERVADHATNLSEMVVFMVEGRDIRHKKKKPSV